MYINIPDAAIPEIKIIEGVNHKHREAFAQIYKMLRKDMVYYADRLFRNLEANGEDVIQDIFIAMWQKNGLFFRNMHELKAYIYASVRNRLKNDLRHNVYSKNYFREHLMESAAISEMAETEIISVISRYEKFLPYECARVFRLHLDGWSVKEIATKLDKSESTVYHQRTEIFKILREKLSKSDMRILILLILSSTHLRSSAADRTAPTAEDSGD